MSQGVLRGQETAVIKDHEYVGVAGFRDNGTTIQTPALKPVTEQLRQTVPVAGVLVKVPGVM